MEHGVKSAYRCWKGVHSVYFPPDIYRGGWLQIMVDQKQDRILQKVFISCWVTVQYVCFECSLKLEPERKKSSYQLLKVCESSRPRGGVPKKQNKYYDGPYQHVCTTPKVCTIRIIVYYVTILLRVWMWYQCVCFQRSLKLEPGRDSHDRSRASL